MSSKLRVMWVHFKTAWRVLALRM